MADGGRDQVEREFAVFVLRVGGDVQDRVVVEIEMSACRDVQSAHICGSIAWPVRVADEARAHDGRAAVFDVEVQEIAQRAVDEIVLARDDEMVVVALARDVAFNAAIAGDERVGRGAAHQDVAENQAAAVVRERGAVADREIDRDAVRTGCFDRAGVADFAVQRADRQAHGV